MALSCTEQRFVAQEAATGHHTRLHSRLRLPCHHCRLGCGWIAPALPAWGQGSDFSHIVVGSCLYPAFWCMTGAVKRYRATWCNGHTARTEALDVTDNTLLFALHPYCLPSMSEEQTILRSQRNSGFRHYGTFLRSRLSLFSPQVAHGTFPFPVCYNIVPIYGTQR